MKTSVYQFNGIKTNVPGTDFTVAETITYFLIVKGVRDNSRLRDAHEWRNRGRGSPTRHRSSACAKVAQGRSRGARTLGLWKHSTANWSPPSRTRTHGRFEKKSKAKSVVSPSFSYVVRFQRWKKKWRVYI